MLLARPDLRTHGPCPDEDHCGGGYPGQRQGGKRGAMNHEPVTGSPRAVRARLRDQATHEQNAPFAVARRCSFVERRPALTAHAQMNLAARAGMDRNAQDSWDPSAIEHGTFGSVGSAIEVAEGRSQHATQGHARGGGRGYPQAQANMHHQPQNAPRGHRHKELRNGPEARAAPLPTPVRSMAVQTNRESIMRHHKRNGGSPESSDGDGEDSPPRRPRGQENNDALNSDRSHMTGKSAFTGIDNMSVLNTARNVMKDLKYPAQDKRTRITAVSEGVMTKAISRSDGKGKAALAEALACAMNDEFDYLDHQWGIASGSESVEGRVACVLKKIATRAEKECTLKSLASGKVPRSSTGSLIEGENVSTQDLCAEAEAKIAAKDREIAYLREALQKPVQLQESGPHNVLADLATRLSAPQSGLTAALFPAEIADNVDKSLQGLVAVEASCRQMFQQAQEEQQFQQERNREFCPPAGPEVVRNPLMAIR